MVTNLVSRCVEQVAESVQAVMVDLPVGFQKLHLGPKPLLAVTVGGRLGASGDLLLERFDGSFGRIGDRFNQCLVLVDELRPRLLDTQVCSRVSSARSQRRKSAYAPGATRHMEALGRPCRRIVPPRAGIGTNR